MAELIKRNASQFALLILIILMVSCKSRKSKNSLPNVHLTESLTGLDSFNVIINYRVLNGCVDVNHPNTLSVYFKYKTYEVALSTSDTVIFYGPFKGNVLPLIQRFETMADSLPGCGGYKGGLGILGSIKVNNATKNFAYCQESWDGIFGLIKEVQLVAMQK